MIYFESILCGLHVLVDENIITERERGCVEESEEEEEWMGKTVTI